MRPKKRILLAASDEQRASELRYLLYLNSYAVAGAEDAPDALNLLVSQPFDLVLMDWPFGDSADLIRLAFDLEIPSLAFATGTKEPPDCFADAVLFGSVSAVALLDRVKTLTIRKRGPKPIKKPSVSARAILIHDRRTA